MLRPVCALFLAAASGAIAQAPPAFEFDVVSIKPSPDPEPGRPVNVGCRGGPGTADPAIFRCTNMNLANLITTAYSIMRFQLSGPDWMQGQRFDVAAKAPEGTSKEQANVMLQNMLVGRFKLSVHHESRDVAKYDLVVARGGPKLKDSLEAPPPPSAGPPDVSLPKVDKDMYPVLKPGQAGTIIMNGRARMFRPNATMQQFAQTLSGQCGKPVTDATGLTGKYDISLYWAVEALRAGPSAEPPRGDPGPTLEQAIQDQLGLRLVSTKGPVDFTVVDHLEKAPTDN
jgi:uncharacterized protein (TIGR03435 family)